MLLLLSVLLLSLLRPLLGLNYTEQQRQVLLQLPADLRKIKVRLFGDEEMIAEDVRETIMRSDSRGSRWSYPTSSTHELTLLYRAELSLLTSLRQMILQVCVKTLGICHALCVMCHVVKCHVLSVTRHVSCLMCVMCAAGRGWP